MMQWKKGKKSPFEGWGEIEKLCHDGKKVP